MTELQHYCEGTALLLLEAETIRADQTSAYAEACSKLNEKFGIKRTTAVEMIEEVLMGKVLQDKDTGSLLNLYASLSSIYKMAKEMGHENEFENRMPICTSANGGPPRRQDFAGCRFIRFTGAGRR